MDDKYFIENCKLLGLKKLSCEYDAFIKQAENQNWGFYQFLLHIIENEAVAKKERSIVYRIQQSKLPTPLKLLADFDFSFQPSINPKLIMDLATMNFMKHKDSILFIGDCGVGKSHLTQSIAVIACQKGYRVLYTTCAKLIYDLNIGVYEKTMMTRLRKYVSYDLLIIDEMGHDRLELEVVKEAHLLFKVIDERYKLKAPIIFTSNVKELDWAEFLGDPITTKAILDRIFHHSVKIDIKGPSYREHKGKMLQDKYVNSHPGI
ncbi:MAG: ATP-binding protein [Candidatus Omnitrophica bacterium]|nr:ATP-binding protein [Candidatus Omnitrophota bacterium]